MKNLLIKTGLVFLILATVACSSSPTKLRAVPDKTRMQVISVVPDKIRDDVDGREAVGRQAGKGALNGAGMGAYVGSACGPLFIICSPVFAVAGGAIGLVGGGIYGGVIALPEEKEAAFNEIIANNFSENPLHKQLEQAFINAAIKNWEFTDENPELTVSLKLEKFELSQHSGDELAIHLTASFFVTYAQQEGKPTGVFAFSYKGDRHKVDHFLENQGKNFNEEIHLAQLTLAKRIYDYLKNPIYSRPRSSSGSSPGFVESVMSSSAGMSNFKIH